MKNYLFFLKKYKTLYLSAVLGASFSIPFNSIAADAVVYTDTITSSADGYTIDLTANNAKISKTPTIASNGDFFYQVGNTYKIEKGASQVRFSGMVRCHGDFSKVFPGAKTKGWTPFHRIFTYSPQAPFLINNQATFQLSYNTFATIKPEAPILNNWSSETNSTAVHCRNEFNKSTTKKIDSFRYQFPFYITIYIKKRNIDGVTVIPSSEFAAYTRAWTNLSDLSLAKGVLPQSMPISSTSAPMRLVGATLISPAECRTDVGYNLVINHGVLNAEKYESRVVRPINFSCDHVVPTPVEFELFYTKDGDPQQRLPLKVDGTNRTIYSKIQMIDAETGNRGQKFTSRVGQYKQIQIESILKGTNASGGNYSGTAVLIAAYP